METGDGMSREDGSVGRGKRCCFMCSLWLALAKLGSPTNEAREEAGVAAWPPARPPSALASLPRSAGLARSARSSAVAEHSMSPSHGEVSGKIWKRPKASGPLSAIASLDGDGQVDGCI